MYIPSAMNPNEHNLSTTEIPDVTCHVTLLLNSVPTLIAKTALLKRVYKALGIRFVKMKTRSIHLS